MNITKTIILEEITCGTCGITHAVPEDWIKNRRATAGDIHCPNGCRRVWKESDADRLKKQLEDRERELRASKCETLHQRQLLEMERTAKAVLETKLARVKNRVCPCCRRSFVNLVRHMKTKHCKPIS